MKTFVQLAQHLLGDLVEGFARLNISGDKAWGQLTVYYKYVPDSGRCTVKRVEFDQLQAHPAGRK